eukprot:2321495-Karenia_brevis.AAC.1
MLTQQCRLSGENYSQLWQRSGEARKLASTTETEINHHYATAPDCSHIIDRNVYPLSVDVTQDSRLATLSRETEATAHHAQIVEWAVGGLLKP